MTSTKLPVGGPKAVGAPAHELASVRYQVKDIDRAIAFYTKQLGFKVEQQTGADDR